MQVLIDTLNLLPPASCLLPFVRFSPDGELLATVGDDKKIRLWNLQGQQITTYILSNRIQESGVRIQQCFLNEKADSAGGKRVLDSGALASLRASRLNNRRFCTLTKLKIWWS